MQMSVTERVLLGLIYGSVTGRVGSIGLDAHSGVCWQSLYSLAMRQGVGAIVLDAIGMLPSEVRPPKPLLLQWIGQGAAMGRMYAEHSGRIASLARFYGEHGIGVLLLKGYGCSLCYPKPEHRPVGDVNVYLFGRQDEADALVEKELGIEVHRQYHKHSTFCYGGVEVENHAKFIGDVSHKSNVRFEQILMSVLKRGGSACLARWTMCCCLRLRLMPCFCYVTLASTLPRTRLCLGMYWMLACSSCGIIR